jgi:hypothetical protein
MGYNFCALTDNQNVKILTSNGYVLHNHRGELNETNTHESK